MINKPIAVILPVYKNDNETYLRLSINSILKQTYNNIHVYIGVDGPIDLDLSTCLDEYSIYNKINIIYFKENRGLAATLNDLLQICFRYKYEFIARMDADDISIPDRIEKQINFLKNNPDIDIVGGAIREIDSSGNFNGKIIKYPLTSDECKKMFAYRDPLAHPAVLFRRTFFNKVFGYRPEFRKNQDTMLWFDAFMNKCKIANIPDVVLSFRVSNDLYKRRKGFSFSKKLLANRLYINRSLHYSIKADIYALCMFFIRMLPTPIIRFLYKIR